MRRVWVAGICLTALALGMAWYLFLGNPQAPRPVPGGALRFVVFGDSLGFGWGTSHPQRQGFVPALFERLRLERPGSTLRNLSKPGTFWPQFRKIVAGASER